MPDYDIEFNEAYGEWWVIDTATHECISAHDTRIGAEAALAALAFEEDGGDEAVTRIVGGPT